MPRTTMWQTDSAPHCGMAHRDMARQLTENDYHLPVWHDATMWNGLKRRMECLTNLVDYSAEWQFRYVAWGREGQNVSYN